MLRFSAKLDRFETDGDAFNEDVSLRGVGSGVVEVEEIALLVLIDCGLITGERFDCEGLRGCPDEPGRDDVDDDGAGFVAAFGCAMMKWSCWRDEPLSALSVPILYQRCGDGDRPCVRHFGDLA